MRGEREKVKGEEVKRGKVKRGKGKGEEGKGEKKVEFASKFNLFYNS